MNDRDYSECKTRVKKLERKRAEAVGALKVLKKRLQDEFDVTTKEEGETKLVEYQDKAKELKEKLGVLGEDITKTLDEIESELSDG